MNELISVIMAVYKESKDELEDAIYSILKQTYTNLELIIVLDNPDDTWRYNFIKNIDDKRVVLVLNDVNMGLPKSLNKALSLAKGKYIARMDADDISQLDRLEKQKKFLESRECDLCGCNFVSFYNNGMNKKIKMPQKDISIKKALRYTNCIGHPTWFGKKIVFDKNNGYRNIFACEDYDFLLRAAKNNFILGNVSEELLNYRVNLNSISRKNAGKQMVITNLLSKAFKNGNTLSEKELKDYLNTEKCEDEIKKYNNYYKLKYEKNANNKYCLKEIIIYLKLIFFSKYVVKDIFRKVYMKYILFCEKKEKYE